MDLKRNGGNAERESFSSRLTGWGILGKRAGLLEEARESNNVTFFFSSDRPSNAPRKRGIKVQVH